MRIDLKVPTSWGELDMDQFRVVASLMNENLTEEELLFCAFCRLAKIKARLMIPAIKRSGEDSDRWMRRFLTENGEEFYLQDYEIAKFSGMLSWIIDKDASHIGTPNPTSVDWTLDGISFGQWFYADAMFYRYGVSPHKIFIIKALRKLKSKPLRINANTVTMVLLWWRGVMERLAMLYPNVLQTGDADGEAQDPSQNWRNIMLMLNDDKPQENERIENANVHDVLAALDSRIEKQKQLEQMNKKSL